MFSGDSLSVLLFLLGTAIAGVMGALTAPTGWRANTLWGVAGVFGLASIGWLVAPTASPFIQAFRPVAVAIVQSGALVMVGTVGVVALMVGRQSAPGQSNSAKPEIDLSAILSQINAAIDKADWEDYTPDTSNIISAMAELDSAFTTLQKKCGLITPKLSQQSKASLILGVRFLRTVRPYLVAGHIEEAKEAAAKFLGN